MITITLNQIKAHDPCEYGWEKILSATHLHGGDFDKPFLLLDALDNNGLDDALWARRCLPEHDRMWRKYAVWCARQVQHLMTDQRSIRVLDVADRYADGMETYEELEAAKESAWTAWTELAQLSARPDAWAARAAGDAARAAQAEKLRQILNDGQWVEDDA